MTPAMAILPSPTRSLQIHYSASAAGPCRRKSPSSNHPPVVVSAADLPDRDRFSARSPSPVHPALRELKNALPVLTSAAGVAGAGYLFYRLFTRPPTDGGGWGDGGGGGGWGWGWGGEGDGFWHDALAPTPAFAKEEKEQGGTTICDPHGLAPNMQEGHAFNVGARDQAYLNMFHTLPNLFSSTRLNPRVDTKNDGLILEMVFPEKECNNAEVAAAWSIISVNGRPKLRSLRPGGEVKFHFRNIKGLNSSISGAISSRNLLILLDPTDDSSFKVQYAHPYVDGVADPRSRTLNISCFAKLSPVFIGIWPDVGRATPVRIVREGLKANITENFTRQSNFTYGLVMEKIKALDRVGNACTHGVRPLATGELSTVDHRAYVQANLTRDYTKSINGGLVGGRDIFQLDQGFGIGSNSPFFNRYQLTVTRFLQLKQVEVGKGKPKPPLLVLHGHYGGCTGDLPTYDVFVLGGPYSLRGYSIGELGVCRNILELAAELRIPVRNTYVYAFAEHGKDLGSSGNVQGNPTEFFRRPGQGSSYGAGVKLGNLRAEYAVDHNSGTGSMFLNIGERF